MTIRIEKETDRLKTMIRVSGRLQSKHLDELKTQLEGDQSRIVLDLNGVTLVDVEIVRFLNACEKGGVELLNSWPYIQEWMIREKGRKGLGGAVLVTKTDPRTKRGNSNGKYYRTKNRSHHEACHFHYSWRRDCYVPGTCKWLPPALALEEKVRSVRRKIP